MNLNDFHEEWTKVDDDEEGEYLGGTVVIILDEYTCVIKSHYTGRLWECRHNDGVVIEVERFYL